MMEQYAFAVTLPVPESENEWRKIVKDPSRFVAKKLAKGVEVSWQRLNQEQRAAIAEAKQIEIKEWISSSGPSCSWTSTSRALHEDALGACSEGHQ